MNPSNAAPDAARHAALFRWLTAQGRPIVHLTLASADASFRRYYRVHYPDGSTAIALDAPPDREPLTPWLNLRHHLAAHALPVPDCYVVDPQQGFALIEDFGDTTLETLLAPTAHAVACSPSSAPPFGSTSPPSPEPYSPSPPSPSSSAPPLPLTEVHDRYAEALANLILLQSTPPPSDLPRYDAATLRAELDLFPTWYLQRHLGHTLTATEADALERTFTLLIDNALAQPHLLVHRDYHSRNLMWLPPDHPKRPAATLGILDFQDALVGPIAYDLVSLLKDAYLEWPEPFTLDLLIRYWQQARRLSLPVPHHFDCLYRDYEWIGIQRHLKILGIFARLAYRDQKPAYLDHLPRVRRYLWRTLPRYPEFKSLLRLLLSLHPDEHHFLLL
ncbi:MAG: phosphotransferase [Hydrogenophilus sp.]|nr:phosphotransferase [Hydrogenophilus sp.]